MLTHSEKQQLDELGYLVLPGFVPPPMLDELRDRVEALWATEGDDAGSEFRPEPGTRRLANLVDKGAIFAELVSMPRILECIEHVIGPGYKLSSLNARSTNPHNGEAQPWHADAGAIVDERGYWVCNSRVDARRLHRGERRHADGAALAYLAAPARTRQRRRACPAKRSSPARREPWSS